MCVGGNTSGIGDHGAYGGRGSLFSGDDGLGIHDEEEQLHVHHGAGCNQVGDGGVE